MLLAYGRKTVAEVGTAEQLARQQAGGFLVIQALRANTGVVAVGLPPETPQQPRKLGNLGGPAASSGSENTPVLVRGREIGFHCEDLRQIFIDSSVADEGVVWWLFSQAPYLA